MASPSEDCCPTATIEVWAESQSTRSTVSGNCHWDLKCWRIDSWSDLMYSLVKGTTNAIKAMRPRVSWMFHADWSGVSMKVCVMDCRVVALLSGRNTHWWTTWNWALVKWSTCIGWREDLVWLTQRLKFSNRWRVIMMLAFSCRGKCEPRACHQWRKKKHNVLMSQGCCYHYHALCKNAGSSGKSEWEHLVLVVMGSHCKAEKCSGLMVIWKWTSWGLIDTNQVSFESIGRTICRVTIWNFMCLMCWLKAFKSIMSHFPPSFLESTKYFE